MTASGLPVVLKSERPETANDLPVPEPGQPAQSGPHDDRKVLLISSHRNVDGFVALGSGLDKLLGNVPGDLKSLSHGSTLSHQAR